MKDILSIRILRPIGLTIFLLILSILMAQPSSASQSFSYGYDVLNRLTAVNNNDGDTVNYTYDAAGNITHIASSSTSTDFDNDGLPDALEKTTCTDPFNADTDADGIPDGVEDADQNGIVDAGETNPCQADTDGDGIQDGTESGYTEAGVNPDTDLAEFHPDLDPSTHTDPLDSDTDDDGLTDGEEDTNFNGRVDAGESDPLAVDNFPTPVASIDYISVNPPADQTLFKLGQIISFRGSGGPADQEITAYEWRIVRLVNGVEEGEAAILSTQTEFLDGDLAAGSYRLSFTVKNSFDRWAVPVSRDITVSERIDSDLEINRGDIRFTTISGEEVDNPQVGDTVYVRARVSNSGVVATPDELVVSLYDGNLLPENFIADVAVSRIEAGGAATVSLPWTVSETGCKILTATVEYTANLGLEDADKPIPEDSFQNNQATAVIPAGPANACEGGITMTADISSGTLYPGHRATIYGEAHYDWGNQIPVMGAEVTIVLSNGAQYTTRTISPTGQYAHTIYLPSAGAYTAYVTVFDGRRSGSAEFTFTVVSPPVTTYVDLTPISGVQCSVSFSGEDVYGQIYSITGSDVAIQARVTNRGNIASSGGFYVYFFDGHPDSGELLSTVRLSGLAAGESVIVDLPDLWTPETAGNHTIYVFVDAEKEIDESDEFNNICGRFIGIRDRMPDLTVQHSSACPIRFSGSGIYRTSPRSCSLAGEVVTLTATVSNAGNHPVEGGFQVGFYDGPPEDGVLIGLATVSGDLAPGASATASTSTWAPSGVRVHTVYVVADPFEAITESSETNNECGSDIDIRASKPDLQPYGSGSGAAGGLSFSTDAVVVGNKVTLYARIYNVGPEDLGQTAFNVLFSDGDPESGGLFIGSVPLEGPLVSGDSLTAVFEWDTTDVETGEHRIWVVADAADDVNEDFEDNNSSYNILHVLPDACVLKPEEIKFSTYGPEPEADIQIFARLKNHGGQICSDKTVEFYQGHPDSGGLPIEPFPLSGTVHTWEDVVIPQDWTTPDVEGWVPICVRMGEYTLCREIYVHKYTPPPPDLRVYSEDMDIDPPVPCIGDAVSVWADIHNMGGQTATDVVVRFYTDSYSGIYSELGDPVGIAELAPAGSIQVQATVPIDMIESAYVVKVEITPGPEGEANYDDNAATTSFVDQCGNPCADAGQDRSIETGETVQLNGGGSCTSVTAFAWRILALPEWSRAELADANTVFPTLTADVAGDYTIELKTSDGVSSDWDEVVVHVTSSCGDSDLDCDGMADACELQYFGNLDRDGTGDADDDGITDADECAGGTDPTSSNAPTDPSIASPADNSETTVLQPALVINNSTDPDNDALYYDFEVYTDEGYTLLEAAQAGVPETSGTTAWTVPAQLVDNTRYYWRVRATDGVGTSQWVYSRFFVNTENDPPGAFNVSTPQDGSDVDTVTPILSVTNSTDIDGDALTYAFSVFSDSGMTQAVAGTTGLVPGGGGTTAWTVDTPMDDNTWYYWQAVVTDEHGAETAASPASFFINTSNDAPEAPSIDSPANGSEIGTLAVELSVNNALDPDGDSLVYTFEIDTVNTFDSPNLTASGEIVEQTDTTAWSVAGLTDNTDYFWRAKAGDGYANSPWTVSQFFTNTANDAPGVPTLKNPGDGAWVVTLTPQLAVNPATDIDNDLLSYQFEIYADEAMTQLFASHLADAPEWVVTPTLADNTRYFWRVRAEDEHGLTSGWMEMVSLFTDSNGVDDPPVIQLTTPSGNLWTNADSVQIGWTDEDPDSNAQISIYYYADGGTGGDVLMTGGLSEDPDGESDTWHWDTSAIAEGVYYVYATIADQSSSVTSYGNGSITIDRTPPEVTATPSGGNYSDPVDVSIAANETATIYYTVDGTAPTTSSPIYSAPLELTDTTTLSFMAIDAAGNPSEVATEIYNIDGSIPGDLNGDGVIDSADYMVFRSTLGKCTGDAAFIAEADYDEDGCITLADYRIWYGYYR